MFPHAGGPLWPAGAPSTEHAESYETSYPSSRLLTFDLGKIGLGKHHVRALLEVDVTEARRRIRKLRHTGMHVSFFGWLLKTASDCVALPYGVRKADQKTLGQVYQEIESTKSESVTSEGEYVLGVGR